MSSIDIPPTRAAPSIAPMLVPAYTVGTMPRSSNACITPICAKPFIPPPPRTRAMRRELEAAVMRDSLSTGRLLQILVQSDQADHSAADHDDGAWIAAD